MFSWSYLRSIKTIKMKTDSKSKKKNKEKKIELKIIDISKNPIKKVEK